MDRIRDIGITVEVVGMEVGRTRVKEVAASWCRGDHGTDSEESREEEASQQIIALLNLLIIVLLIS
jgi:hypothetical protein